MTLRTMFLASLAVLGPIAGARAMTFDLSTVATATPPPFSISSGGTTATFSSPAGNGFVVGDTTGLFSFSTALEDMNFFGGPDPLTISFSKPVANEILIPFGIFDAFGTGDTLSITTNTGMTSIFTTRGDGLPLNQPEGVIALVPSAAITSLTLSSSQQFAIGNVTVPEPISLSLLGAGLAGMAVVRRKSRAA